MSNSRVLKRQRKRRGGMAIVTMVMLMGMVVLLGTALTTLTVTNARQARRDETRTVLFNLAEGGMQQILLTMWTPFRNSEKFTWHDANYAGAGTASTAWKGTVSANLNGGRFAAYVIGYTNVDAYTRDLTIRSVGWFDLDNSGGNAPGANEPYFAEDLRIRLKLQQAHVFDYAYFVNNYGWMTGFTSNNLWVNGDMRANGDFNVTGGTINGQVIAASNPYLRGSGTSWGAPGTASITAGNLTNTNYAANVTTRARQAYSATSHGTKSSTEFNSWKDLLYDQSPDASVSVASDVMYGSVIADSTGTRQLSNQSNKLSTTPTALLPMPDLSDITYYRDTVSATYSDPKTTYADGTANPDAGQPAYIEVWNASTSSYQRLTGQSGDAPGTITGSAALIGDSLHPIKIHGPVTVMGDIAIKGVVSGQGTLYAGRNVHVIGSVTYANPPAFVGTDPTAIDQSNEKKTMLALCARGSVMMGNVKNFTTSSPLNYMMPPFTQDRMDDVTGAITPAFDASQIDAGYVMADGTTPKKYQSLLGDTWINANAGSVNQIDAVIYTNNCAGGLVGDGSGAGFTINGSIIAKDEAMVANLGSGRMTMNYDNRIKERSISNIPLIDIRLPRIPTLLRYGWKSIKL